MSRFLVLLLALTCLHLCAEARFANAEPDLISSQIVDLINTSEPILLDIQAGDLTSDLDYNIRQKLLEKGADLRELSTAAEDNFSEQPSDSVSQPRLASFALAKARLVKITVELGGTTIERKSFLSYHSERYPLYTFQVRQISLPGNKLEKIDSLSFIDKTSKPERQPLTTIKWFEPVIASTALASIIYLLWTTE